MNAAKYSYMRLYCNNPWASTIFKEAICEYTVMRFRNSFVFEMH